MQRGLQRANDWDARLWAACPIIYQAGERGAGQLEEKGRYLCHRPSIHPHRDRQTGTNTVYRDITKGN